MENGRLAVLAHAPADLDVLHQDDGGVDHRTGQHDDGHQGDHGHVPPGEGQGEQRPGEGHRQDEHDHDGHGKGLKLHGQHEVDQQQGHGQGQPQVAEAVHHVLIGTGGLGGVALGQGVLVQNFVDGLGDGGAVAADGVAGDGHLAGLVVAGDALGGLLHRDIGHGGQGHGAAVGGGDGHGAQGVQADGGGPIALDHHVILLVIDGHLGGGGTGELGTDGGTHSGGGKPILRGGLPLHGHPHLGHLVGQGALHIDGIGQGGDLLGQVVGDHLQGIIVVALDLHADVVAAGGAHRHGGGGHGDLAPGDVLKGRTQIVYDVKGGAVAV